MAELRLTKNELRLQQLHLGTLKKYLPTLQLKKAMLQTEVNGARVEFQAAEKEHTKVRGEVDTYGALLSERLSFNPFAALKAKEIVRGYENIAGIELPFFKSIAFEEFPYALFDTPPWVDAVIAGLRRLVEADVRVTIAREKQAILEQELRDVSIKVNLFEKILIPRALRNIRKIKVFLGDQQLSAVCQAKVAKNKIEERKKSLEMGAF